MKQELLTLAELLQTLGGIAVPADPERTAAQTELLLESLYQGLDIQRINAPWNVVLLSRTSTAWMMLRQQRQHSAMSLLQIIGQTMALAKALQRNDEFHAGETLQVAWNKSLGELRGRTAHLFPDPVVPPAPAGPACFVPSTLDAQERAIGFSLDSSKVSLKKIS